MNQSVSKKVLFFCLHLKDDRKPTSARRGHVRGERQRLCRLYYRNRNSKAVVFPSGLVLFFFFSHPLHPSLCTSFHPYFSFFLSSLLASLPFGLPSPFLLLESLHLWYLSFSCIVFSFLHPFIMSLLPSYSHSSCPPFALHQFVLQSLVCLLCFFPSLFPLPSNMSNGK